MFDYIMVFYAQLSVTNPTTALIWTKNPKSVQAEIFSFVIE